MDGQAIEGLVVAAAVGGLGFMLAFVDPEGLSERTRGMLLAWGKTPGRRLGLGIALLITGGVILIDAIARLS